jgi:hypothetical protein
MAPVIGTGDRSATNEATCRAAPPATDVARKELERNQDFASALEDMAGATGRELAEKVRAVVPGVRTLCMSGYTANVIARRRRLDDDVEILPKPVSPTQLAERVGGMLGK